MAEAELSKNQIIAQSIFPRLDVRRFRQDESYQQTIEQLVQEGVGGFCIMNGSPAQVAGVYDQLQSQAPFPLLFAADFEWGLPMRLDGGTAFPNAYALGIANDQPLSFRVAECIAREARTIGVHWNFAPVADVVSNLNTVILGVRSFGETAEKVIYHLLPFIQGIQHHQVGACVKHFPGHGTTTKDSHSTLPVVSVTLSQLQQQDLLPFLAAIQHGVRSIMISHVAYPELEPDRKIVPASLSPTIVTQLLREHLHYEGLIITDALDMKAVTDFASGQELAIRAKMAGNDILLMPTQPLETLDQLRNAVESQTLQFTDFEQSFQRLYAAKQWVGLLGNSPTDLPLRVEEHRQVALFAAQRALQWTQTTSDSVLPLNRWDEIAVLAFVDNDIDINYATLAFQYIAQWYDRDCQMGYIDTQISPAEIDRLYEHLRSSDIFLFLIFATHRAQQLITNRERIWTIMQQFRRQRRAIAVILGNPIVAESATRDFNILQTYSFTEPSIAVAMAELFDKNLVPQTEAQQ